MKIIVEDQYKNSPRDITVAAARECYSKRTITPDECTQWHMSDVLLKDLFVAGHTTTLEHWHITFALEGVSRHFIWRYLHGFPFYSTDQQSQRYVEMKKENFYIPSNILDEDKKDWENFYETCYDKYQELIPKYVKHFNDNDLLNKQTKKSEHKKALEFARYLLPIGQTANMKYTLNLITLLRLIGYLSSLDESFEVYEEAKEFAFEMEKIILDIEPKLEPLIKLSKNEFQNTLSKIDNIKTDYNKTFERFNGNMTNLLSAENLNLKSILNIEKTQNFKMNPVLQNFEINEDFVSEILVSHSCDSQNQRHRTTFGFRDKIENYFIELKEKYYIPKMLELDLELKREYVDFMDYIYIFFDKQKEKYNFNTAIYLLPNAQKVYFIEKNSMAYFPHKAQKRLCFNAQEEIFYMTKEMVLSLEKHIDIWDYNLIAPCHVNDKYGIKPTCPEGSRFCGVKVWKFKDIKELERII